MNAKNQVLEQGSKLLVDKFPKDSSLNKAYKSKKSYMLE